MGQRSGLASRAPLVRSGHVPGPARDPPARLAGHPSGVISPNDPRWEPDPTGQRLAMIRASRRGALVSVLIFGPVVWAAVAFTPPEAFGAPNGAGIWALVMSLPGLALLGASLTLSVHGSRGSAAIAGVAMGVGVPVAAVASGMIAVYLVALVLMDADLAGEAAGLVLRDGVIAAVGVAPLIAIGSALWVVIVRRMVRRIPR